jgi:hypothetical protein
MNETGGTPDVLEQALFSRKKLIKLTINEELPILSWSVDVK